MRDRLLVLASSILCLGVPVLLIGLGAVLVCPMGTCGTPDVDRQLLVVLNSVRQPWLDTFFALATWLGSMALLLPAAFSLAWRLRQRQRHLSALLFGLSLAGAWLLALAAKLAVGRPRPELFSYLTVTPTDLSFPSAHAMQVTGFALGWLFFGRERHGWGGVAGALALIAVVAVSRPYLQVHFPSDVLFGVAAATAWVLGLKFLLARRMESLPPGGGRRGATA